MNHSHLEKFQSIRDFPELVEYLRNELDWPIQTDDFEEMTFEYSAVELGLNEKIAPKFLEIRRLRPLDKCQPWGIFFIRFDHSKLPVVALRRLLKTLVLKNRSTSNTGDRASWHESDLLLISQTGNRGTRSLSFAHFAANPEKTDLPVLKVLGWDDDDTGLKIDHVIETLREKLIWPINTTDSEAWRTQWRDAFTLQYREVIQSSKEMAERLGQLALAIRTRLRELLKIESLEDPIHKLMSVFRENLISDLDTNSFSDMYAQTIAYGLLSARIINPKANTADATHTQIPITNPFLRDLMKTFLNIGGRSHSSGVGLDFDELGINEVVDLLDNTNLEAVLRDFGDRNQKEDPVMHFFEGFLKEYDGEIKAERGVFYTPQPIVSFIVRSVDEQLRTDFGLEDGLADTTTWGELASRIKELKIPEGTPPNQAFVQILDPAVGTGTFPVEVIGLIYKTMTVKWQAQGSREARIKELWNEYVPKHLLPRLHGYELMMAPYAIAHMKIGLKLYETGYTFGSNERVRVFLTNALESSQDYSGTFSFAIPALANESKEVNSVKDTHRFTVVIGNPPYSGRSYNLSPELRKIVEPYRHINGFKIEERGALQLEKSIQEDYIKFIRSAQIALEHSAYGMIGFVTSHGFLDNPTLRGMRNSLLDSFSHMNIINMHGNISRGDESPDGTKDENVFDIKKTGVSISMLSRNMMSSYPRKVFISDIWGGREQKYNWLSENIASTCQSTMIRPNAPQFLFVVENLESKDEYECGYSVAKILPSYSKGLVTGRDAFVTDFDSAPLLARMRDFADLASSDAVIIEKYNLNPTPWWNVKDARKKIPPTENHKDYLRPMLYRPFDTRVCFYHPSVFMSPRRPVMMNQGPDGKNLFLITSRMTKGESFAHVTVCDGLAEAILLSSKTSNNAMIFPLYLSKNSSDDNHSEMDLDYKFTTAFEKVFVQDMAKQIKMKFIQKPEGNLKSTFDSQNVFNYIFSILHSPMYRVRYGEFLKRDFPKIPLPSSSKLFVELNCLGEKLVALHLLKFRLKNNQLPKKIGSKEFRVEKVSYFNNTVWIDKGTTCGFEGVQEDVWNFHIGGYQVCEKWLKVRGPKNGNPGRILTDEDIAHYQKIIITLSETISVMTHIDEVIDKHGGWPGAFLNSSSG